MSQIRIIVKDLDKTIKYYEEILGLGPFVKPEIKWDKKFYYVKLVKSEWIMGFCSLGAIGMEPIQPITGPTIYHDFLEKKGEGLHHLGFDVKDMDKRLNMYKEMNIEIIR